MVEHVERRSYLADAPVALMVGCGDMGMGCARALGRRSPVFLVDIDADRLGRCVQALSHEGYTVRGLRCDIADEA